MRKSVKNEDTEANYSSGLVKEQYNKKACYPDGLLAKIALCREELAHISKSDWYYSRLGGALYELEKRAYLRKLERDYVKKQKRA